MRYNDVHKMRVCKLQAIKTIWYNFKHFNAFFISFAVPSNIALFICGINKPYYVFARKLDVYNESKKSEKLQNCTKHLKNIHTRYKCTVRTQNFANSFDFFYFSRFLYIHNRRHKIQKAVHAFFECALSDTSKCKFPFKNFSIDSMFTDIVYVSTILYAHILCFLCMTSKINSLCFELHLHTNSTYIPFRFLAHVNCKHRRLFSYSLKMKKKKLHTNRLSLYAGKCVAFILIFLHLSAGRYDVIVNESRTPLLCLTAKTKNEKKTTFFA